MWGWTERFMWPLSPFQQFSVPGVSVPDDPHSMPQGKVTILISKKTVN